MFNNFLNRNKEYKEAYLKMDENEKVIEKEKVVREELGRTNDYNRHNINNTNEPIQSQNNDSIVSNSDNISVGEPVVGMEDVPEEDNHIDKPKDPFKGTLFLAFWILLFISTAIYYVPTISNVLNSEIKYQNVPFISKNKDDASEEDSIQTGNTSNVVLESDKDETSTENNVKGSAKEDTLIGEDTSIKDKLLGEASIAADSFSKDINTSNSQDIAVIYADAHAEIVESSGILRESVQGYLVGSNSHINMSSVGNRVNMSIKRIEFKLNDVDDGEMKNLLNNRIERMTSFTKRMSTFDKSSAESSFNSFIDEENNDSQKFINLFSSYLDRNNRAYRVENDIIYYE